VLLKQRAVDFEATLASVRAAAAAETSSLAEENRKLRAQLEGARVLSQKANSALERSAAASLDHVVEQQASLSKDRGDLTVGALFSAHGFDLVYADNTAIPNYITKKLFRQCLDLPSSGESPTDHQRKLLKVAESFLFQSCAEMNKDAPRLFDLVAERRLMPSNEKESVASSPVVVAIVQEAKVAIEAGLPQGAVAKILAPLSVQYTRDEMKSVHELDLSVRQWRFARWHKAAWGAMGDAPAEKVWKLEGDAESATRMLKFVENNVQTIAFGDGELEGPGGVMITIPQYIRDTARGELYDTYAAEEKAAGKKPKGKKSFVKWMRKVAKKDPKALSALDPGAVKGKDAIARLKTVHLPELLELLPSTVLSETARPAVKAAIEGVLDESREAIAGLEKHLATCAQTSPSHCAAHLLSDPDGKDPTLAAPCTHAHPVRCSTCEAHRVARAKLDGLLDMLPSKAGEQSEPKNHCEIRGLIRRDLGLLDHYYAHEVRAAHENSSPSKIIEALDGTTCFTTADWKMKFMAYQFREAQTDFFGKRGIPWHGQMIAFKEGNELRVEYLDCIVRDSKEDALSAFQQMAVGWKAFSIRHPRHSRTHLRTDGASCYSGVQFAKLLAMAPELCGMTVLSHLIGEGGKNKTSLDGHFGQRGVMARREVIKGQGSKDVVDAESLAAVLASDRLSGSYVQLTTTNRAEFIMSGIDNTDGIAHMAERVYEYDGEGSFVGLRLRQQTALGIGRFISAGSLLGSTVAGDIPLATEHAVDELVFTPHNVVRTTAQKEAAITAAAEERDAREAQKKMARDEATKNSAVGRLMASALHACCHAVGGHVHCSRSFFSERALYCHINRQPSAHTGGVFRPWALGTTRKVEGGEVASSSALRVTRSRQTGDARVAVSKAPEMPSKEHQRWSGEFAASQATRTESGAPMGATRPAVEGWCGHVDIPGFAVPVILPPVPAGAAVYRQVDREGRRTVAQFDILVACYIVGSCSKADATQKLNHWEVARIMKMACTPDGVKEVARKNPKLALFVAAAERGEALLSSRLEVLDPAQVKCYLGKSEAELAALRKNVISRSEKRIAALRKNLTTAEDKVGRGESLMKAEKQSILVRVLQLAGWDEAATDAKIYKDATAGNKDHSAGAVNSLFDTYVNSLQPPAVSSVPWASLRLPSAAAAPISPPVALTALPAAAPAAAAPAVAAAAAVPAAAASATASASTSAPAFAPTSALPASASGAADGASENQQSQRVSKRQRRAPFRPGD